VSGAQQSNAHGAKQTVHDIAFAQRKELLC
jgi:hypothetical protein